MKLSVIEDLINNFDNLSEIELFFYLQKSLDNLEYEMKRVAAGNFSANFRKRFFLKLSKFIFLLLDAKIKRNKNLLDKIKKDYEDYKKQIEASFEANKKRLLLSAQKKEFAQSIKNKNKLKKL